MRYRAAFFDAGETLLAPHPSFPELFAAVMGERGHALTAGDVEEGLAAVAPTFVEALDRTAGKTWSTSREESRRFWRTIYASMFGRWGIADPDDSLFEALYDRFTRYESYRLFPDAVPSLLALREAGLTVGLISNFEEWLEGMLIEMEVAHLFDVMAISGKEGVEKPDPALFRLALTRAGVEAAESVYVGDHPRLDAEAAAAVGMTGVLIDRRGRYPEFAGPRIAGLGELLPLLGVDPGTSPPARTL